MPVQVAVERLVKGVVEDAQVHAVAHLAIRLVGRAALLSIEDDRNASAQTADRRRHVGTGGSMEVPRLLPAPQVPRWIPKAYSPAAASPTSCGTSCEPSPVTRRTDGAEVPDAAAQIDAVRNLFGLPPAAREDGSAAPPPPPPSLFGGSGEKKKKDPNSGPRVATTEELFQAVFTGKKLE